MKSGICDLFIAGALVAFAGCSSETPSTANFNPTSTQMNNYTDAGKVVETLTARRIIVKVQSCISGTGGATFSAKGKAKGRVGGKFAASGGWNFFNSGGQTIWTFAETFKIKGKRPVVGTITGNGTDAIVTCKTFGPVSNTKDLTYHLRTASGAATTNLMKNGGKLLERMR